MEAMTRICHQDGAKQKAVRTRRGYHGFLLQNYRADYVLNAGLLTYRSQRTVRADLQPGYGSRYLGWR